MTEAQHNLITSPDGEVAVEFWLRDGAPRYSISHRKQVVLKESRMGVICEDVDFTTNLKLASTTDPQPVQDRYEIVTGKRRVNLYRANRAVFHLEAAIGQKMEVIFQVSNDGVAFRYFFPETSNELHRISREATTFHFPARTKAWLQPMQVAKSGYEQTNPAYEEFYLKEIDIGQPSPLGAGWVYPALFCSGDTWIVISESSLGRGYCGTRLGHESPDGEYTIAFPDPRENFNGGAVNPQSPLPWYTPWRVIAVGDLKTIAESTLGTDVANPPSQPSDASSFPGKASWSWLLGDSQTTFDVQKQFIDYAAEMGWKYCLIDAFWDAQIGYDRVKELVDYARARNVGILLWYNSAGNWNTTRHSPRDKMLSRESRIGEFAKLKAMGIKGLKVDFFGGDGQSVISYYLDILEDAAPFGFAMNFHGSTLPRGWQRTYPHLMTMEGIRGFEFVTFEQANADEEPSHAAMLPFTRNLFDPMDFTPVCLHKVNDRIQRRTSAAFELALSVLFISGIQHYPETPQGMAEMPAFVRDFMKRVPAVWDDSKFIDGFPGRFAVFARHGGGKWFLAGINAQALENQLTLDLRDLAGLTAGTLITDGLGGGFEKRAVNIGADRALQLTLKSNGGFVVVFN